MKDAPSKVNDDHGEQSASERTEEKTAIFFT